MTPPAQAATLPVDISDPEASHGELRRWRWALITALAAVVFAWAGWISLAVISQQATLERLLERQSLQHEQLREVVIEIKEALARRE